MTTPSSLTRADREAYLLALEERKLRRLKAKPKYKPNSGQLPVHMSRQLVRFVFSANGAGKTALLVNEVIAVMRGTNPWTGDKTALPAKIAVVVDNSVKVTEVFLPELRKWMAVDESWLKRDGKPYISRIVTDNGSQVSFFSAESDPMLFEGVQFHYVFIDEPVPRNLYVALRRSLRIKGYPCRMLFCGTAISEAWLKRDIYDVWAKGESEDVECFTVGIEVNRANLPEGYIESFGRALSDAEKEVRLKGGFFGGDGLALAHLFHRDVHLIKRSELHWDPNWPVVIGFDPHPVKKHVAIMVGADKNNRRIVLKELALKATAENFGKAVKEWIKGYRVVDMVCDSLGSQEGTGNEGFATFIEILRDKCQLPVRATRYEEKSHEDLIDRLQSGLLIPDVPDQFGKKIPSLRIVGDCLGVISDVESACWLRTRGTEEYKPKLDTSSKDFLSATGYALAANVHIKRGNEKPHFMKKRPYGMELPSRTRLKGRVGHLRVKIR